MSDSMATLRLAAQDLDPNVVSKILATKPQVSARRGERLYRDSSSRAVAKEGTWFVTTEGTLESSPADHLNKLLDLLSPKIELLREEIPDVKVRFTLLVRNPAYSRDKVPKKILSEIEHLGEFDLDNGAA